MTSHCFMRIGLAEVVRGRTCKVVFKMRPDHPSLTRHVTIDLQSSAALRILIRLLRLPQNIMQHVETRPPSEKI